LLNDPKVAYRDEICYFGCQLVYYALVTFKPPPPDKIGGALYCFCLRAPITLVTPLICVFFGMHIYRTRYDCDAFILSSNSAVAITVYRPLFRTAWVRRYQKGKTSLDLNEARGDGVLGVAVASSFGNCLNHTILVKF